MRIFNLADGVHRTLTTQINELVDVTKAGFNDMDIVRQMKVIVPEFKSKHSKYEALD